MMRFSCRWIGFAVIVGFCSMAWGAAPGAPNADLEKAFRYLETYAWGQSRQPLHPIEAAIQSSAGDSAGRHQLETRLAAVLRSGAPFPAKQYACHKLSQIGTVESIPALAPLLSDLGLSHPARLALERIPDPRAAAALRDALAKTEGNTKIGIISSLGVLGDAAAVGLLAELLAHPQGPIAAAAASALGHIPTMEAAKALEQSRTTISKAVQPAVTQARFVAAGRLLQNGQHAEAARIYGQLYNAAEAASVRLAAFRGLALSEPEGRFHLLTKAIASDNVQERHFAVRVIEDTSSASEVNRFIESFQSYSPAAQAALLEAFRCRHEALARPAALAAVGSNDMFVRLAGLRALTTIGTAADVPMLARNAVGPVAEAKALARAALASAPDPQIDSAIVALLPASSPEASVELFNALVARGAEEAAPMVAARLNDPSATVRTAALKALAELGGAAEVSAVVVSLKAAAGEAAREAAQSTLVAIAGRAGAGCVDDILKGLEGADTEARISLLRALGDAGGPKALGAVCAALADGDARVKESSFRVLVEWSSVDAAPELLRLATTSAEPDWRVLAFRGFIRLCREADCPPEERGRLLAEGMRIARDAEEKRLVIAAVGEAQNARVLRLLGPCFDDPALAQEACLAVVTVAAGAGPEDENDLLPWLRQAFRVSTSQDVREKARAMLERLGEKLE